MEPLTINPSGAWQIYWGVAPLPHGAQALGTVRRGIGDTGALIRLASGVYVQGNALVFRSLPQREIRDARARSAAAATLGSKGGAAGRGESKSRGDSEHYRRLATQRKRAGRRPAK